MLQKTNRGKSVLSLFYLCFLILFCHIHPSNLVKWTISEKDGKVSLTNKLLLENLFVPSFILNDSLSPEEGSNYIR
jgi:phosphoglycerol transferase MdoB-like AlkP superfamily enzyme